VDITLHISLLFLLFIVYLGSSTQFHEVVKFSGIDPNKITGSPSLWGFFFTLSLVTSIFVHELSHVIVAQKNGGKVRQINLMMLGGVSEIEFLPQTPSIEIKVSIIGPLVSIAIGTVLYQLHHFIGGENLAFYGFWVGQLNIGLGIFNLIPAFPTDGGRILRAFLVSRQGPIKGTQNAVKVSNLFSILFVTVGVLTSNLILVLIAFFIYAASKSELFTMVAKKALEGLTVRDLVSSVPKILIPQKTSSPTIDIDEPLEKALKLGVSSGVSSIPVLDHDEMIGLIRISDLIETIQNKQITDNG
jgi:Zn-dependent protease